MSQETDKQDAAPDAPDTKKQELPVTVLAQYIRDVSFENPNAPESLRAGEKPPETDINIGMDVRKIPDETHDNMYEVLLSVRASATRESLPLFMLEMQYGVTVLVDKKVDEDNIHPLLMIEMPRLSFPFVRMLVSQLTSHGGFPPLFLAPVDFYTLYMERFAEGTAGGEAETSEAPAPEETIN